MQTPRHPMAFVALFFCGLAACRSVAAPAPDVSPGTTTAPVAAARATHTPPVVAPARCVGDRGDCLREGLPVVAHALPEFARSPESALAALRASRSPAPRAWAAYLAHHAGDDVGARSLLDELARDGEAPALASDTESDVAARALLLVREHAELLINEEPHVVEMLPCSVFAWDPAAAARAFGPTHGSTRDVIVEPFKRRCVAEALDEALPAAASARVLAAMDAVTRALFREWPRREDGTGWVGLAIAAQETLRDALLAVEGAPVAEQDAAVRTLVARLATVDPDSLLRLGRYRRSAEGQVGALANGICAVARLRGRPMTGGRCQRRAYTATLAAFTVWVGALHDV